MDYTVETLRSRRAGSFLKLISNLRKKLTRTSFNVRDVVIHVSVPKRLDPYSFRVGDYIDALNPTTEESLVLESVFALGILRQRIIKDYRELLAFASIGKHWAEKINIREKLGAG